MPNPPAAGTGPAQPACTVPTQPAAQGHATHDHAGQGIAAHRRGGITAPVAWRRGTAARRCSVVRFYSEWHTGKERSMLTDKGGRGWMAEDDAAWRL
jgi:hypothetical protein